ncbi:MAG: hypothetical protein Q4D29_11810, partial [Lachnospiraceae bacterium]|nr:hypothetical protein [Lachnospiraceae bacterium]
RYNRAKNKPDSITRELQFKQYSIFYNRLVAMGYRGYFGKNTFTRCNDNGVSSYLWYRMDQGIPYKGFGISAQSMGNRGISYGSLKNIDTERLPEIASIGATANYCLPESEMAAKYVSIAMYNGRFRLDSLSKILGEDAEKAFSDELLYLTTK